MNFRESAFLFGCEGDELLGLIATPAVDVEMLEVGVLVVVGGPQYRVGSHRQFVSLSRFLAENGVSCMRFDYRGMGDASGNARSFEEVDDDLKAAMDEFFRQVPRLKTVVIWGLCDGASAACLYVCHDSRVVGLVLLNPWVKTDAGVARAFLKHYYLRRLFDLSFWKKLFSGRVSIGKSAGELVGAAKFARGTESVEPENVSLPERMGAALSTGAVPFVFFLSRRDFVAREFEDVARRVPTWQQLLKRDSCFGIQHFEADHTFSTTKAKADVAYATLEQVRLFARRQGDLL